MNKLIQALVNYLEDQVRSVLHATNGGDARLAFMGAPTDILRQILDYFMASGGISVTISGVNYIVPVYLLDNVSVNPEGINSGCCDDSHLTHVRNRCPYFLALVPPHKLENKSISTSTSLIGVPRLSESQKWRQHSFIQQFVGLALSARGCDDEIFEECVDHIFQDAESLDEHLNDHAWHWKIIDVLFNIGNPKNEHHDEVIAACGLPCTSIERSSVRRAQQVMGKIVDRMTSAGLINFFEELLSGSQLEEIFADQKDMIDLTRLAIGAFRGHLLRQITTAQQFESAPRIYYSPYRLSADTAELPIWWKLLNVELWDKLLEDGSTEPEEELNIKLENVLFNTKKGHPYVVSDAPLFRVAKTENGTLPKKVIVDRAVGARSMIPVTEIDTSLSCEWKDNSLPEHEKNLRYKFSAFDGQLKDSNIRLISLEKFVPGVVIDARAAKKASILKKAKGTTQRKAIWECDINLLGKDMQHHFDVYFNEKVELANNVKYFASNGKQLQEDEFHSEQKGKKQIVLDLDEEGYIELTGNIRGTKKEFVIRAQIHLEEMEASGVRSWFEKLVELHCKSSSNLSTHRIDVSWSKSQQLAKWILDEKESYYPLVMGYDYRENWKNPSWNSMPIMSKYSFSNDIRPHKESFIPPDNLLECRESVRNLVNGEDGIIELINLGELAEDPSVLAKVVAYLKAYSEWLETDRDNALWFDTITVIGPEATDSVLSQQPDALLLNPMHPLRIGWQLLAQNVLYSSLMRQKYCPAAGVLNPCATPDCIMLPCWTAGQNVHPVHFISVANNSDYWSVLWNGNTIDRLNNREIGKLFDEDFGIKIDGIAAGFTVSQVERAMKDIAIIRSARTCLKVRLIDDTIGSSSCTEGIVAWAEDYLGENDQWKTAGPISLELYDARNRMQWPSTRQVANLTSDTLATVRWFSGSRRDGNTIDLTIVNHLGSMNPGLAKHDISSAVGLGTLIRQRIRRQLPTQTGNQFVSESRKSPPQKEQADDLPRIIENLSWQLENTCDGIDSYIFAPKMIKIQENLKDSRYCAVSSTIVDPSCFFDADKSAYIWDYDMPSYSRRAGSNNGYYLIASETKAILQAVRRNLSEIAPNGYQLDDDLIRSILREISGRGFPTLKRLVVQGASSTGEIGLLVALRILQNIESVSESLFPLSLHKHVNLVIPIDPFRNMIADLKGKLGMSGSRPDILAVSIHYHHQDISVKFTPIEVKHRSGVLLDSEKKLALEQATEFSKFMTEMESLAEIEHIWRIGMTNLLVTMIDFGFRAMSVAKGMGGSKAWAEIHSGVLKAIMSGEAKREIDKRGRVIIIDQSISNTLDLDNDSFMETLAIQTADAFNIISSENHEMMKKIKSKLHNWDLLSRQNESKENGPVELNRIEHNGTAAPTPPIINTPSKQESPVTAETMQESTEPSGLDSRTLGVYFSVGKDITSPFQDPDVYFHPSNTQLNQLNIGIVGDLGTGKTQLTKSLIYRFIKSEKENRGIRPKFLIFDYKGDYLDKDFIDAVGGQLVKPHRIPLNLFDLSGKDVANPIINTISFFNDVIGKIYKVDKPNQQYQLKEAIKGCYSSLNVSNAVYPTIYDVHNAYRIKINEKVDSTLSILSDIVDQELFENKTAEVVPFKEFFKGITVIDLKTLGQDDNTKNMLVVIFLNLFYDHMLKIEKKAPVGDNPTLRYIDSLLLVDEANSIMKYNFDVLDNILLQGREFGVGVLLASQYLSHFRTQQKNYAQPLLTWFIHKVPNITKKELESIGLTDIDTDIIERIKSLNLHECLYKSFDTRKKGTFMYGYPFYKIVKKS